MNKAISIAAAIAAAALAIYLLIGSSESEERPKAGGETSRAQDSDSADRAAVNDEDRARRVPRPLRMSGSEGGTDVEQGSLDAPRHYIRSDGTTVRDHRSEAVSENYERRVTLPKSLSPVQPETLAAVRTALRPAMRECIATHAPDAPEGSSAQAVLTVSIQSEELTVDKLQLSTEGLAEDEALKACIHDVMLGHRQTVGGAKDVEAHTMTFPYDL